MTLTYNPNLAKVKVDLHTESQGRRSNGSAVRVQTDGQMDGRYQVHYLPPFAVNNYLEPCRIKKNTMYITLASKC